MNSIHTVFKAPAANKCSRFGGKNVIHNLTKIYIKCIKITSLNNFIKYLSCNLSHVSPAHTLRPISLRSTLILYYHQCPSLPSDIGPKIFPANILYSFLMCHACYSVRPSRPPQFVHRNNMSRSTTWGAPQ
jgi:hypothetical protein